MLSINPSCDVSVVSNTPTLLFVESPLLIVDNVIKFAIIIGKKKNQ